MRRLSQVVTTGRAAYSTLWTNDQYGSGWVGETASRPATSNAVFTPLVFPAGEIYAMPVVTQRLLDDAAVNIEDHLGTALSDEFTRQEGIAFVSGDGVNKPMGFLRHAPGDIAETVHPGGALSVTPSGQADGIKTDALIDLKYGLGAPYRQNATWLMNSQTAAVLAKLKDGQGNYVWREALLASEPATLLGRPVEIDENMPNIAAGTLPIAFGDFQRGYLVNDRIGVRILRDPYSNKPFIMFYTTKRVGGGLLDPKAIRLLKVAAA
jgi:HK97 family phage major capsid protein